MMMNDAEQQHHHRAPAATGRPLLDFAGSGGPPRAVGDDDDADSPLTPAKCAAQRILRDGAAFTEALASSASNSRGVSPSRADDVDDESNGNGNAALHFTWENMMPPPPDPVGMGDPDETKSMGGRTATPDDFSPTPQGPFAQKNTTTTSSGFLKGAGPAQSSAHIGDFGPQQSLWSVHGGASSSTTPMTMSRQTSYQHQTNSQGGQQLHREGRAASGGSLGATPQGSLLFEVGGPERRHHVPPSPPSQRSITPAAPAAGSYSYPSAIAEYARAMATERRSAALNSVHAPPAPDVADFARFVRAADLPDTVACMALGQAVTAASPALLAAGLAQWRPAARAGAGVAVQTLVVGQMPYFVDAAGVGRLLVELAATDAAVAAAGGAPFAASAIVAVRAHERNKTSSHHQQNANGQSNNNSNSARRCGLWFVELSAEPRFKMVLDALLATHRKALVSDTHVTVVSGGTTLERWAAGRDAFLQRLMAEVPDVRRDAHSRFQKGLGPVTIDLCTDRATYRRMHEQAKQSNQPYSYSATPGNLAAPQVPLVPTPFPSAVRGQTPPNLAVPPDSRRFNSHNSNSSRSTPAGSHAGNASALRVSARPFVPPGSADATPTTTPADSSAKPWPVTGPPGAAAAVSAGPPPTWRRQSPPPGPSPAASPPAPLDVGTASGQGAPNTNHTTDAW